METLILYPKTEAQLTAFKAMAKALKVDFKTEESPYDLNLLKRFYKAGRILKMEKALK